MRRRGRRTMRRGVRRDEKRKGEMEETIKNLLTLYTSLSPSLPLSPYSLLPPFPPSPPSEHYSILPGLSRIVEKVGQC